MADHAGGGSARGLQEKVLISVEKYKGTAALLEPAHLARFCQIMYLV